MKLSTGKVAFPLQFDNGDVENIFINPHDAGLQDRIKGFEKSIQARLEKINLDKYKAAFDDEIDISSLDFAKIMNMSEEEIKKVSEKTDAISQIDKEVEKEICEEIDSVFDSDVSSKAFKYVSPLSMIKNENGEFEPYIISVLQALAYEVQKYGSKMKNSTNKYIEKYSKNK